MKASKSYFIIMCCIIGVLSLALMISLVGFFRSVERSGGYTETKIKTVLESLQDNLKNTEDSSEAKLAWRRAGTLLGLSAMSDPIRDVDKTYNKVLTVYSSKPKEVEKNYLLSKKSYQNSLRHNFELFA